jgi:uncharacterized phage protein (TIGR01671 family)
MSRPIKFEYILRNHKTGQLARTIYWLDLIQSGGLMHEDMNTYGIVARRQSTGLCDKNQTDIYEDDLIKHLGKIYRVCWNDWAAGFDCPHPDDDDMTPNRFLYDLVWSGSDGCEVIGNVYEHPELLEASGAPTPTPAQSDTSSSA